MFIFMNLVIPKYYLIPNLYLNDLDYFSDFLNPWLFNQDLNQFLALTTFKSFFCPIPHPFINFSPPPIDIIQPLLVL